MKFSQYNSIIPYESKNAIYNSFYNKVIFVEKELVTLINENLENINNIRNIHPTFYQHLVKEKYIISREVDEIQEVRNISQIVDNNYDSFLLTVNPTMNCNFKCWYCYETQIKNSRTEENVLNSIKNLITNQLDKEDIKYFSLSFFGGEPLLFFSRTVKPLVNHLRVKSKEKNKDIGISFTTNGFLINDDFIDYFIDNQLNVFLQITLDGYKEEHDKVRYISKNRGSYERIVENILKLLKNDNFKVRVRINYTEDNLGSCFKIMDDFAGLQSNVKKDRLEFDFHRVWQDDKNDMIGDILNKGVKEIREKGFNVLVKYTFDNVKKSCYADKRNSVVVNYNGDIYKCTARDFSHENRMGYIKEDGMLIWENNSLEYRMNSKFKNKPCLSCKILPICNGGCSQHAVDHMEDNDDYCVLFNDNEEINKVITAKIDEIIDRRYNER